MVAMIDTDWVRRTVMEKFTTRWTVPPKRDVQLHSTTRIVEAAEEPIEEPSPIAQRVECCSMCGERLTDYPYRRNGSGVGTHDRCAVLSNQSKAPPAVNAVDAFKERFAGELSRCRAYYSLSYTPEPSMLNTYEGWQAMGRQVKRGSKAFKFSNAFASALAELKVFPDKAVSTMRYKAGRYADVALFVADCTDGISSQTPRTGKKSRR